MGGKRIRPVPFYFIYIYIYNTKHTSYSIIVSMKLCLLEPNTLNLLKLFELIKRVEAVVVCDHFLWDSYKLVNSVVSLRQASST